MCVSGRGETERVKETDGTERNLREPRPNGCGFTPLIDVTTVGDVAKPNTAGTPVALAEEAGIDEPRERASTCRQGPALEG